MLRKIIAVFMILFAGNAFAADEINLGAEFGGEPQNTECATRAFADALADSATLVSESDSEQAIKDWIYDIFLAPETLVAVTSCPEVMDAEDDDIIIFMPIQYVFPGGREIVVNYQTTAKVLRQRLQLAHKRELPDSNPNPEISQNDPHATWVNTDPAWYAIMVTRPGVLNEFVGKDKNNTVSFKWVKDNIDSIYPADLDGVCSTRSGIGAKINNAMVHKVIREKTAQIEDDKNNYYVAGDIDLRWVSYAEIALDIALTIVTWGASAAATGAIKGARAAKITSNLAKNMKRLTKIDKVKDYVRSSVNVAKAERRVENITKMEKSLKNIASLEEKLAKTAKGTKKYDRIAEQLNNARKIHADDLAKMGKDADRLGDIKDLDKLADMRKASSKEIEETRKLMEQMAKDNKDVAEYVKNFDAIKDVSKYAKDLRAFKKARTGNVFSRAWQGIKNSRKTMKAIHGGTKKLDKAAKVARHGMKSGRARDWLFHATRRNMARVTRVTEDLAALSFVLGLLGDFYDRTEVSTDEFSNGIEMEPLSLLSADSIEGQDNVVNYGMWLMWAGDSTSAEDDDAAYLQAMDFAQKFFQDLNETQTETGRKACDVDIYVVRPVIRNPGTDHQALYWLIMNDEPWTTGEL
ncbi:MAG: hypothetical protein J5613_00355 [Alphaproteobacteria bacterium]|nr:hypothetical protein [Alphaproteobacteria bacterium]